MKLRLIAKKKKLSCSSEEGENRSETGLLRNKTELRMIVADENVLHFSF
jgi:hypothetical protein